MHGSGKQSRKGDVSRRNEARDNFLLAVLFIGMVPLLPVIVELIITKQIGEQSLMITAAVYSITIALASNSRLYFGSFLVASLIEVAIYGSVADPSAHLAYGQVLGIKISSNNSSALPDNLYLFIAIAIPFASLVVERYSRHIRNREEVFEFLKGKEA
jgi:hypothetical protein